MWVLDQLVTAISVYYAVGSDYRSACQAVSDVISPASNVYYPGHRLYAKGVYHYAASSEQKPACVVEPGTADDVGRILQVIDATRTPFAVKSGGHITYDADSRTAVIGSGLVWDTVYDRLHDYGVTVVGGRASGVGVGGSLLGGGYSYKTNQYGLSIDSIVGYNLVLPNGTVTYVTQSTHPDLFFGLKGGFNNFGIVTDFTMNVFPQTEVWGGQITYRSSNFDEVRKAISDFSVRVQDPKAAIVPAYVSNAGVPSVTQSIFYDGPTPPSGIFDGFTNIPCVSRDLKTRSYVDMISSTKADSAAGLRGSFHMVSVSHFSEIFLKAVEQEMKYWTKRLLPKGGLVISYTAEPFLPSYLSHANSPSAFPPPSARLGRAPSLLLIQFGWMERCHDEEFITAVSESANRLAAIADAEGSLYENPPTLYGNYANSETPLAYIYGGNLPRLRALKAKIDPDDVMGLTGGFKF